MRFRKGSKVEVLSTKDCILGSWQCAEIISGNGHTYSVRFGRFPIASDAVVDRVPRKDIRPCPPYAEGPGDWIPGDLVEVFDDLSWKTARVVEAMGGNHFLARLLFVPTSVVLRIHSSHIRARQCWQDGKWFLVGKGIESCITTSIKKKTKKQCAGEDIPMAEKNIGRLKPQMVSISTNTRKRGSAFSSLHVDTYPVAAQKMRRSIKDCQMVPGHSFPSHEKVDASVSPQNITSGKYMHASFNIGTNMGMGEPTRFTDSFGAGNLAPNDSDSCASSVASCSVISSSPCYLLDNMPHRDNDIDSYCSDAESFCGRGCEDEGCSPPPKEELVEVPRAELGVYNCIVESLYAAGPWTWEEEGQESLESVLVWMSLFNSMLELTCLIELRILEVMAVLSYNWSQHFRTEAVRDPLPAGIWSYREVINPYKGKIKQDVFGRLSFCCNCVC